MKSNEQDDFSDEKLTGEDLKKRTAQKEKLRKKNNAGGLIDVSSVNNLSVKDIQELSAGRAITDTIAASVDNFKGEVTYSYWWDNDGGRFNLHTSQYRITKFNGQSGGNKANLNLFLMSGELWGNASPDAMWQDGDWHSYVRGGSVLALPTVYVIAEFIFDKSGNDPSAGDIRVYNK
ncbi:hypothetical protein [Pseudomonas sp. LB3P38]|uniref:hypothetical protein n=1 Tax=Pseudomonas lyxosi TaxID=3398358 RepID=UPI0039F0841C